MLIKILQTLKHDLREWIECIVAGWPETFLGKKMRIYYWSKKFNLKTKPVVGRGSKLYGPTIVIGNNFTCGEDVEINATKSNGVFIGNNVLMASNTYLRAANHHFESIDTPINQQGHYSATIAHKDGNYSIVIEDDVWIGANSILLSGTKVGTGSVVGAGSVISKEFPPYSIIAGNPAQIILDRTKI